jgi:predicted RNA binding protein with dsRBD fold (UPF0201 family)
MVDRSLQRITARFRDHHIHDSIRFFVMITKSAVSAEMKFIS